MTSYKYVGTTNRHVYLQSEETGETEEDDFPALETSLEVELRLDLKYRQQEYKKCQKFGLTQFADLCIHRINRLYRINNRHTKNTNLCIRKINELYHINNRHTQLATFCIHRINELYY